jgi:hypothetical protein
LDFHERREISLPPQQLTGFWSIISRDVSLIQILQKKTDVFIPGIKLPVADLGHSSPTSARIKNEHSYSSTPPIRLRSIYNDNLTLDFPLIVAPVLETDGNQLYQKQFQGGYREADKYSGVSDSVTQNLQVYACD